MLLRVKDFCQTCFACPSQFEGYTESEDYVYIRFRHNKLRLEINNKIILKVDNVTNDPTSGYLSIDDIIKVLKIQGVTLEILNWVNDPIEISDLMRKFDEDI